MRLKINFGLIEVREVSWFQPLTSFPNIINYLGKNYEWVAFDTDPTGKVDQILIFSQLQTYDPNYNVVCPIWSEMFKDSFGACECGANFTSFPWDHMKFCQMWKKW